MVHELEICILLVLPVCVRRNRAGVVRQNRGHNAQNCHLSHHTGRFFCTFTVQWNKKAFKKMRYKEEIKELSVLKRNLSFFKQRFTT